MRRAQDLVRCCGGFEPGRFDNGHALTVIHSRRVHDVSPCSSLPRARHDRRDDEQKGDGHEALDETGQRCGRSNRPAPWRRWAGSGRWDGPSPEFRWPNQRVARCRTLRR
jgi:hypothetical protein